MASLPEKVGSDPENEKGELHDNSPPGYSSDDPKRRVSVDKAAEKAQEVIENDPDAGKSPEERAAIERKLLWKIDLLIIPWMCLLYLLSFLDRTNIGNARLAGMEEDLGMSGLDYNVALTIFVRLGILFCLRQC